MCPTPSRSFRPRPTSRLPSWRRRHRPRRRPSRRAHPRRRSHPNRRPRRPVRPIRLRHRPPHRLRRRPPRRLRRYRLRPHRHRHRLRRRHPRRRRPANVRERANRNEAEQNEGQSGKRPQSRGIARQPDTDNCLSAVFLYSERRAYHARPDKAIHDHYPLQKGEDIYAAQNKRRSLVAARGGGGGWRHWR